MSEFRGTMVVAFICIAALPLPSLVYRFGPRLRSKDHKTREMSKVEC